MASEITGSSTVVNRLHRLTSKKTSKTKLSTLCEGNPLIAGGFRSQRVNNAESVSMAWRHFICLWHWTELPKWCYISLANREICWNDQIFVFVCMCEIYFNGSFFVFLCWIENITFPNICTVICLRKMSTIFSMKLYWVSTFEVPQDWIRIKKSITAWRKYALIHSQLVAC